MNTEISEEIIFSYVKEYHNSQYIYTAFDQNKTTYEIYKYKYTQEILLESKLEDFNVREYGLNEILKPILQYLEK